VSEQLASSEVYDFDSRVAIRSGYDALEV
jgi:hypothetical protein